MHYCRLKKRGSVGGPEPRRRGQGKGTIDAYGYRHISVEAPDGTFYYQVKEHRYVYGQLVGRPLKPNESVHHKNGDRLDNRPENLELWVTQQPSGQRVQDRVRDALRLLKEYADVAWLWPAQADELRHALGSYDPNEPEEILELPPPRNVFQTRQLSMW